MRLDPKLTLLIGALAIPQPALAVDGVIEINQAKALAGGVTATDTPGFPVTIDTAGSYRLTSDLNGGAVAITSSNVTLDLNGFVISYAGEAVYTSSTNVAVTNGTVSDGEYPYAINLDDAGRVDRVRVMGGGVRLGSNCILTNSQMEGGMVSVGEHCLVAGSYLSGFDGTGLSAQAGSRILNNSVSLFYGSCISVSGGNCVVSGNTVSDCYTSGIGAHDCVIENNHITGSYTGIVGDGSMIKGNVVKGNPGGGIEADDATVIGNVVKDNTYGYGLLANTSTGYKDNQFDNNNSGNSNPQVSGGTEIGTNICGGDTTCP